MPTDTEDAMQIGDKGVRRQNPYGLTNRQHIFPAKSIERFCNNRGFVELNWFATNQPIRLAKPSDGAFLVKRAWTHGAEQHQTKVETQFQAIAERIIRSGMTLQCENSGISEFFALWRSRVRLRHSPIPATQYIHTLPGEDLALDEREILEKKGVHYLTTQTVDGVKRAVAEGRQLAGTLIRLEMDRQLHEMQGVEWRLVTAAAGEFVVPDSFGDVLAVPITPTQILVTGYEGMAPIEWVRSANMQAILSSRNYWFARSMKNVLFP